MLSGGNVRDKLALLAGAECPRDLWRSMEDRVAVGGNSFRIQACINAGVGEDYLQVWPPGARRELVGAPPCVVMEDLASARVQPQLAATVLDRLAAMDVTPRIFECALRG